MRILIESQSSRETFERAIVDKALSIGRDPTCDIVLASPFVSREHARLTLRGSRVALESIGLNPTLVNGAEIAPRSEVLLRAGDSVFIQGFVLTVRPDTEAPLRSAEEKAANDEVSSLVERVHNAVISRLDPRLIRLEKVETDEGRRVVIEAIATEVTAASFGDQVAVVRLAALEALGADLLGMVLGSDEAQREVLSSVCAGAEFSSHERLRETLLNALACDLGLELARGTTNQDLQRLRDGLRPAFDRHIYDLSPGLLQYLGRRHLGKEVVDLVFGFGPLTDLLRMPDITEVMVVSRDQIYVEKNGVLEETGKRFINDRVSERIIERIVAPVGRRIDRSVPMVDARLPDGSRVNAVIPPVALKGPSITIRRFSARPLTIDDLISFGAVDGRTAGFLRSCVRGRKNLVISGGTGSGKTTLLNALSSWIGEKERVVTIEDNAELQLQQRHVVTLEAKPPNAEGRGEVSIRDLVRNALRMRPDRIIVGECRGREALDMLQAMNTGHDGSMTTAHSNSPADMLRRFEVMVLEGTDMPVEAIRQQIASAIDIVVQQMRLRDGRRRVVAVAEIVEYDAETRQIIVEPVYLLDASGNLSFTGYLPTFFAELIHKGFASTEEMFVGEPS